MSPPRATCAKKSRQPNKTCWMIRNTARCTLYRRIYGDVRLYCIKRFKPPTQAVSYTLLRLCRPYVRHYLLDHIAALARCGLLQYIFGVAWSVCLFITTVTEPCKNGRTDRVAVLNVDSDYGTKKTSTVEKIQTPHSNAVYTFEGDDVKCCPHTLPGSGRIDRPLTDTVEI